MSERPADVVEDTRSIRVWDLPSRLFHWLLVALIGVQWLAVNGDVSSPQLHSWSSYTILVLVVWRLIWGFIGSPSARFANFLRGPRTVAAYVSSLLHDEHPVIIGHNPMGGWSVVLMMMLAAMQAGSGLFSGNGVLAVVHQVSFNLLLGLIVLHIGAVFLHLFVGEDDLVTPMLSGRKRIPAASTVADQAFAGNRRAAVLLLCVAGVLWVVLRP